jgi:hypothetical protein
MSTGFEKSFGDKSTAAGIDSLDPFERDDFSKKNPSLRRSIAYKVSEKDLLFSWYRKLKELRVALGSRKSPDINDLRKLSIRLIKSYSDDYIEKYPNVDTYAGGFLLNYLSLDVFKSWALEVFKEYRSMYIYILQYIADRELSLWGKQKDIRCLRNAARLYTACAFAAICGPIDPREGEKALRKCIELFILIDDREEAQQVCVAYSKCIRRALSEWEPEDATRAVMQKYLLIAD